MNITLKLKKILTINDLYHKIYTPDGYVDVKHILKDLNYYDDKEAYCLLREKLRELQNGRKCVILGYTCYAVIGSYIYARTTSAAY